MSYYVQADHDEPAHLASNSGYGDFGRWADSLDVARFPQTVHLYEWGWSQHPALLAAELQDAIESSPPVDDDTLTVVRTLLDAAQSAKIVLSVTDGIG